MYYVIVVLCDDDADLHSAITPFSVDDRMGTYLPTYHAFLCSDSIHTQIWNANSFRTS